jgi:hypothetical protein
VSAAGLPALALDGADLACGIRAERNDPPPAGSSPDLERSPPLFRRHACATSRPLPRFRADASARSADCPRGGASLAPTFALAV